MASSAIFAVSVFIPGIHAVAQQEVVVHNFNNNGKDGYAPYAGVISDASGNLYGTTVRGGTYNYGAVFELSPKTGGGWTEKILHSFNSNGTDGSYPYGALVIDTANNLYGTTYYGGFYNEGTAFELSPKTGGWTESILYNFTANGTGGYFPHAGMIADALGNFYGTTAGGRGTVFELSPTGGGNWTEKALYNFQGGTDAWQPNAGLIFDPAGNLYGTTTAGGHNTACYQNAGLGCGTVFELSPAGGGIWTEKVLYEFAGGADGYFPFSSLVLDGSGNLYGTTPYGGGNTTCLNVGISSGCGIVFELTPSTQGGWREKVLHNFNFGNGKDGTIPYGGLIRDASGNLYGTTESTGFNFAYGYGTVFKLSFTTGKWTEKILHNFGNTGKGGDAPAASMIMDAIGNLYGTAGGGAYGDGVVFEVIP
jgi:uncharacterized repeat protein (TIGR03803 family)